MGHGTWYSSPCGILKGKYSDWNTFPSYPEFEEHINSHDIIILHGIYKPHHLHEWILALEMSIIPEALMFPFCAVWLFRWVGWFPVVPSYASRATYLKSHPNTLQRPRKSQRDSCVTRGSGRVWQKVPDFWGWGYGSFRLRFTSQKKPNLFIPPKKVVWLFCLIKIVAGKLQVPQVPPWI